MAVYRSQFSYGIRNKDKPMRFFVKAKTVAPISFDFTMFEVDNEAELRKLVVETLISKLRLMDIEVDGEILEGEDKRRADIQQTC
jgi:hypothetical protein